VQFEVVGADPHKLRERHGALFGWQFDTRGPASPAVAKPGEYGFVERAATSDGTGIPGGVRG
jgi:hypothetical protein